MKHLITIFSILLLLNNIGFAEQKTIYPDILTRKESIDYVIINDLSTKIFSTIQTNIDVSIYPNKYYNFKLMDPTETQNKKFYYVKNGNAELLFDKKTKKLVIISFKYSDNPKSWIVYNYPSGALRAVEIWLTQKQIYVFAPNGKFIRHVILY